MPNVINHKGPKFREYRRTQTENDIITLQKTVEDLQKEIAELKQNSAPTTTRKSNRKEST